MQTSGSLRCQHIPSSAPRPFGVSAPRCSPRAVVPHHNDRAALQRLHADRSSVDQLSLDDNVRLRSEAEAPFRSLRLVLYGFSVVSASIGTLISIPQLIGALNGAPNALAVDNVLQNIAINVACVSVFAWLFRGDWQARDKQMARLAREETLAALPLRLANGKQMALGALRGASRVVIMAGTTAQILDALAAAEPYKAELIRRGVFVVPLPIFTAAPSSSTGDSGEPSTSEPEGALAVVPPEDLRWQATPLKTHKWRSWFEQQLSLTKSATNAQGLFVGLRLDGRVRSSGMGCPPWPRYVAELAPLDEGGKGSWTGFMDGFDGPCDTK